MTFKPGSTFDYSGVVAGLDPSIAWAASSTLKEPLQGIVVGQLTATMSQAPDFSTTHNWIVRLRATASQTSDWITKVGSARRLIGDIKFYDSANPDPVLHTEDFVVQIAPRVTE